MEKTWKPTTGGILSIVAGTVGAIGGIVIAVLGKIAGGLLGVLGLLGAISLPGFDGILPGFLGGIVAALAAIPLILGIVAIIGGVYALKRRKWGLALAGSICSLFCVWFLGIPAIIFVAIGKSEF